MGSLGEDVDVSDITYRNIYTVQSNQMVSDRRITAVRALNGD